MSAILQGAVDTVNSISRTTVSIFSSAISVNYHIGDSIFSVLKYLYSVFISLLYTAFIAIQIALEDLGIFLQECFESLSNFVSIICCLLDHFVDGILYCCQCVKISFLSITSSITSGLDSIFQAVSCCAANAASVFNLIGSSMILLTDLVPRSISSAYTAVFDLFNNSAELSKEYGNKAIESLKNTPPTLYIGLFLGTIASIAVGQATLRIVRQRNVTWRSVLGFLMSIICLLYVSFCTCTCFLYVSGVRFFGASIQLIYRIFVLTINNLRVPMVAHAGDSDDENLVGAIDESDDEDRERQVRKRRNYDRIVEKVNNQENARKRREGSASIEDRLLQEVEREREDKLCVICVDKEKCIMILPCRHLCICESCQIELRSRNNRHRNICPICRKGIKQMIKAYL